MIDLPDPVIDWNASLVLLDNSETLAKEMLILLVNELISVKPQLIDLVKKEDIHALGRLAHKLRGACSYSGTQQLHALSSDLEKATQNNQTWETIKPLTDKLHQIIDAVLAVAPNYIE